MSRSSKRTAAGAGGTGGRGNKDNGNAALSPRRIPLSGVESKHSARHTRLRAVRSMRSSVTRRANVRGHWRSAR